MSPSRARRACRLSVLTCVLLASRPGSLRADSRPATVSLLYGGSLNGESEPCACAEMPLGGLARRAAVIARARRESAAVVVLEAGNVVPAGPEVAVAWLRTERTRLLRPGLDAVSLGAAELNAGPEAVAAALAPVPLLSANVSRRDGREWTPREQVLSAGGLRIGVFGLLDGDEAQRSRWERAGWRITPPASAARGAVARLAQAGAQVIVALLSLPGKLRAARALLTDVEGVDWAILGNGDANLDTPEVVGGTRLLGALEGGRALGRLDLYVTGPVRRGAWRDRRERARLQAMRASYHAQLKGLRPASPDAVRALRAALARTDEQLRVLPNAEGANSFENRLLLLSADVEEPRSGRDTLVP